MCELNLSNVIVLILSTKDRSYDRFKDVQKNGWVKDLQTNGIQCYFYEGGSNSDFLAENTICLDVGDDLKSCSQKLQKALVFVNNLHPECEVVYRTNLSSFIDSRAFIDYISKLKNNNNVSIPDLYAGKIHQFNLIYEKFNLLLEFVFSVYRLVGLDKTIAYKLTEYFFSGIRRGFIHFIKPFNFNFASGSGFFIGRNVINKLTKSSKNLSYVDDVYVRLTIDKDPDLEIERFDFTKNYETIESGRYLDMIEQGLFHYRFKSSNRVFDATLMNAVSCKKILNALVTGSFVK